MKVHILHTKRNIDSPYYIYGVYWRKKKADEEAVRLLTEYPDFYYKPYVESRKVF